MIANDFYIEIADFATDRDALRAVREPVFVDEQQVPLEEEWDELDPRSRHVLARALDGTPIGAGRLTPEHKIGRMAVLREWRGHGVGAAMMQALIDLARDLHYPALELHAQVQAIDFYRHFGFEPYGDEYVEAGILHRSMRRDLAPRAEVVRAAPEPALPNEEREFDSQDGCRDAVLQTLREAHHQLHIYTRDLDPLLFGRADAIDQVRRLALSGRHADVRIIVQEPQLALQSGSPLLPLAQRMTSTIRIRVPVDDVDLQYASAFVLNDRGGFVFRPLGSRYEGSRNAHGPGRHRQLLEYFKQVWERAQPATELRAIGI